MNKDIKNWRILSMIKRLLALLLCLSLLLPVFAFAEDDEDDIDMDDLLDMEDIDFDLDENGDLIIPEDDEEDYFDESAYSSSGTNGHFTVDQLEINSRLPEEDVVNILLIGVDSRPDSRSKDFQGYLLKEQMGDHNNYRKRSDVVMILSIDTVFGTLKITSISRDTLVQIPYPNGSQYWEGPINEAFGIVYNKKTGGLDYSIDAPERLVKTVNHNFGMNIKYFIITNFYGVEEIIEYFGGVDLELSKQEARYINQYINGKSENGVRRSTIMKNSYDLHSEGRQKLKEVDGVQHLDGLQGLVFARYRTIANATDIVRSGRTRRLLQALARPVAEKLKNKELNIVTLLLDLQKYFVTNMNLQAIFNDLWPAVRDSQVMSDISNVTNIIEEYRIPGEKGFSYEGKNVRLTNMRKTAEELQEFIYGEVYGFDN